MIRGCLAQCFYSMNGRIQWLTRSRKPKYNTNTWFSYSSVFKIFQMSKPLATIQYERLEQVYWANCHQLRSVRLDSYTCLMYLQLMITNAQQLHIVYTIFISAPMSEKHCIVMSPHIASDYTPVRNYRFVWKCRLVPWEHHGKVQEDICCLMHWLKALWS